LVLVAIGALLALALLPPGGPLPLLLVVIVLYGASGLSWGALYQTLAAEMAGPGAQGLGAGLATTIIFGGSTVLSPLFGALVDTTGSYTASWGLLMLVLLGVSGLLGPGLRASGPQEEPGTPSVLSEAIRNHDCSWTNTIGS